MKTLKVAMLGFGNAGQAFAEILLDKHEVIMKDYDTDVRVTVIATGSRGCLVNSDGLDLADALRAVREDGRFAYDHPDYWEDVYADCHCAGEPASVVLAREADYDVLLEMTPLQIFTGQPAITHLKTALSRGKHAITANKGPIAWAFKELRDLAMEKGVKFYYETTVMDGTPIFNLVDETLRLCKVTEVHGILNTTTNFVLEELAKGIPYDEVMEEGRRRGFVEADPSMDIDGWDASAKLTALLNVLMGADITPMDVDRVGISEITEADIAAAASRGNVIKLICHGKFEDAPEGENAAERRVVATVKPMEVPKEQLLANIDGTSSVVSITTDLMGKLSIVEHNPEILQTGYGIFSDLLRLIVTI
ncbi:MAG: hypothetical protein IIX88_08160 [Firmicutes bacterium]|nr:hypothetical protein [Bacillota bacterium]